MDNLKKLKQKVKDYSAYKKSKKMFEKEREDYFKEQDKIFEQENFLVAVSFSNQNWQCLRFYIY